MTTQLRAWKGDIKLKVSVINNIKAKISHGQLKHGTYGEMEDGMMRGCAVFISTCQTNHAHTWAEREYGINIMLYRLLDAIYEGLKGTNKDVEWPVRFHEAINPGADLSRVTPKLLYWLMQEILKYEKLWREQDKKNKYADKVVTAITDVAAVLKRWVDTGIPDANVAANAAYVAYAANAAADAAADAAAYAAANAAAYAAYAAANAAADAAAYAVYEAANAAYAANAAANAAYVARKNFYIHMSEKLIDLLKEAPQP